MDSGELRTIADSLGVGPRKKGQKPFEWIGEVAAMAVSAEFRKEEVAAKKAAEKPVEKKEDVKTVADKLRETFKGIELDEETHEYRKGDKKLRSVSDVRKEMFPFDADKVARNMAIASGEKDEAGIAQFVKDQKAAWDATRKAGTAAHKALEESLVGKKPADPDTSIGKATQMIQEMAKGGEIVTELPIASESMGLAGTPDVMIVKETKRGVMTADIVDFKTAGTMEKLEERYKYEVGDVNKLEQYTVQMGMYAKMLEDNGVFPGKLTLLVQLEDGSVQPITGSFANSDALIRKAIGLTKKAAPAKAPAKEPAQGNKDNLSHQAGDALLTQYRQKTREGDVDNQAQKPGEARVAPPAPAQQATTEKPIQANVEATGGVQEGKEVAAGEAPVEKKGAKGHLGEAFSHLGKAADILTKPDGIKSGVGFTHEQWVAAKPHLAAAWKSFKAAGKEFAEFVDEVVGKLGESVRKFLKSESDLTDQAARRSAMEYAAKDLSIRDEKERAKQIALTRAELSGEELAVYNAVMRRGREKGVVALESKDEISWALDPYEKKAHDSIGAEEAGWDAVSKLWQNYVQNMVQQDEQRVRSEVLEKGRQPATLPPTSEMVESFEKNVSWKPVYDAAFTKHQEKLKAPAKKQAVATPKIGDMTTKQIIDYARTSAEYLIRDAALTRKALQKHRDKIAELERQASTLDGSEKSADIRRAQDLRAAAETMRTSEPAPVTTGQQQVEADRKDMTPEQLDLFDFALASPRIWGQGRPKFLDEIGGEQMSIYDLIRDKEEIVQRIMNMDEGLEDALADLHPGENYKPTIHPANREIPLDDQGKPVIPTTNQQAKESDKAHQDRTQNNIKQVRALVDSFSNVFKAITRDKPFGEAMRGLISEIAEVLAVTDPMDSRADPLAWRLTQAGVVSITEKQVLLESARKFTERYNSILADGVLFPEIEGVKVVGSQNVRMISDDAPRAALRLMDMMRAAQWALREQQYGPVETWAATYERDSFGFRFPNGFVLKPSEQQLKKRKGRLKKHKDITALNSEPVDIAFAMGELDAGERARVFELLDTNVSLSFTR